MRNRIAVTISAIALVIAYFLISLRESPPSSEPSLILAELLFERGEYGLCERMCVEALDSAERQGAERIPDVVQAESLLTRLYIHLGMVQLADRHCRRGLQACRTIQGERHPDGAEFHALMRQIWNLRSENGNSGGGHEAIDILKTSVGESDPRMIAALEANAGDCYDRCTPEDAVRAVDIAKVAYGTRHPIYGRCLSTLATALRQTHKFDESERVSKQAIDVLVSALGPEHPQSWAAYRNLASVERARGRSEHADAFFLDSIRIRFRTLTDAELCHFYQQLLDSDQHGYWYEDGISDLYLTEMTRRGGDVVERFLTQKIDALRRGYLQATEERSKADLEDDERIERFMQARYLREHSARNLEFVTALCRIQQKPDPLQILIAGPSQQTYEFPDLPVLDVTIRNVDAERREIGFKESGDYRSGRQARWRIEARNAAGTVQSFHELHGIVIGGGIYQPTTLKPGEGWQTSLVMSNFVETLEPGDYEVRVLYHNDLTIVDWEFIAGLVVCRSAPLRLTVKQRSIETTQDQQQKIRELLASFDDRQPCKLIDGKYGPWAHNFIDPKSDYGRLLMLGWPAVPALIEDLEGEANTPERRAHLLALLFSITGENNPGSKEIWWDGQESAVGIHSVLEQGWSISSKRADENEPSSAGFGFPADPSVRETKLHVASQTAFIERWRNFKQRLRVIRKN